MTQDNSHLGLTLHHSLFSFLWLWILLTKFHHKLEGKCSLFTWFIKVSLRGCEAEWRRMESKAEGANGKCLAQLPNYLPAFNSMPCPSTPNPNKSTLCSIIMFLKWKPMLSFFSFAQNSSVYSSCLTRQVQTFSLIMQDIIILLHPTFPNLFRCNSLPVSYVAIKVRQSPFQTVDGAFPFSLPLLFLAWRAGYSFSSVKT